MNKLGWIKYDENVQFIKFSNYIKKIIVNKGKLLNKDIINNIKTEACKRQNWEIG